MFSGLPLIALLAIFAASAGVIWIAGVKLADTTDILSSRLGLGAALGGVIVLAIATNLPEIAITVSAAMAGNLGVAVGNILGGIAIQTVVIAGMDVAMIAWSMSSTWRSRDVPAEAASSMSLFGTAEGDGARLKYAVKPAGVAIPRRLTTSDHCSLEKPRRDPNVFALFANRTRSRGTMSARSPILSSRPSASASSSASFSPTG